MQYWQIEELVQLRHNATVSNVLEGANAEEQTSASSENSSQQDVQRPEQSRNEQHRIQALASCQS